MKKSAKKSISLKTSPVHLHLEHVQNYSVVTLNRPQAKNAFDPDMIAELTKVFKFLGNRNETDFILLKGEGSAFCAGADLYWMKKMISYSKAENKKDSEKMWTMFETIKNCPKPIIAKVHGAVMGGGLGLLACADYVYAEENTQFCFSEVKLGLAPAVISSFVLRKIPLAFAQPLMIAGTLFTTDQSIAMGLIQKKFSIEISNEEILKPFLLAGPRAMIATKKMLLDLNRDSNWTKKRSTTTALISSLRVEVEAQQRIGAFLSNIKKL